MLVTTSTRDDRVHPGHARKFVKVRFPPFKSNWVLVESHRSSSPSLTF
jgi:prolyl oligopeptidase PreP (S9A serine peptidase family)